MAHVAIVGAGSIGLATAYGLNQAGRHELTVCARRPLPCIRVGPQGAEPVTLSPRVVLDPREAPRPVSWIVLATKAHQTPEAMHWLTALCDSATRVAVLQNGIDHSERVKSAVEENRVVPTVVWIPAESVTPGHVILKGSGRLIVPDSPDGVEFAELFAPSDFTVTPTPDFRTEAWRKLCSNAVSGLMALTGRQVGMFALPESRALALALATECVAVGRAEHARLSDSVPVEIVDEIAAKAPDRGSSILRDRLASRPLEWEARNAIIQKLGRCHGIPTPVSDVIVPLLAAYSDGAANAAPSEPIAGSWLES
jgi:2-dehydropantoate 2-reductase